MKPSLSIIGVGASHPDDITVRAVQCLNEVSAIVVPSKTDMPTDETRLDIIRRFREDMGTVEIAVVHVPRVKDRDKSLPYQESIEKVRAAQESVYAEAFQALLDKGHTRLAIIAWGEPMLFNGMSSIIASVGVFLDCEVTVLPAISSVQTLAAMAHVPIANIGKRVLITSGRDLPEEISDSLEHITVMLTCDEALVHPQLQGWEIAWGCNLGAVGETLIQGVVSEVVPQIREAKVAVRERAGWLFEIANLQRR